MFEIVSRDTYLLFQLLFLYAGTPGFSSRILQYYSQFFHVHKKKTLDYLCAVNCFKDWLLSPQFSIIILFSKCLVMTKTQISQVINLSQLFFKFKYWTYFCFAIINFKCAGSFCSWTFFKIRSIVTKNESFPNM